MSKNLTQKQLDKLWDRTKTEQTLLVADYSSLEIGIQGDFCLRLFKDPQLVHAYDAQFPARKEDAVDLHSNNARNVFGTWLGWTVPEKMTVKGDNGKKVEIVPPWAGETVDKIPVAQFKEHPFGGILRDMVKAIWYGLAYGKGAYGFATLKGFDGKMIGEKKAQEMIDALLNAVPGMRLWFKWVEDYVRANHGVYSLGGRWCDLSIEMETGDEWKFKRAFRRAFNFPMQATGAEIIGDAMVRVMRDKVLRFLGFRTCLQVHDELVLRGPKQNEKAALGLLVGHMQSATANGTPLLFKPKVSGGSASNYAAAK